MQEVSNTLDHVLAGLTKLSLVKPSRRSGPRLARFGTSHVWGWVVTVRERAREDQLVTKWYGQAATCGPGDSAVKETIRYHVTGHDPTHRVTSTLRHTSHESHTDDPHTITRGDLDTDTHTPHHDTTHISRHPPAQPSQRTQSTIIRNIFNSNFRRITRVTRSTHFTHTTPITRIISRLASARRVVHVSLLTFFSTDAPGRETGPFGTQIATQV